MFNALEILKSINLMDFSMIHPEMRKKLQGMLLAMLGGREKFDCTMSKLAEVMADPNSPEARPIKISSDLIPMDLQSLMDRPCEIVDILIETIENLEVFDYSIEIKKIDEKQGFIAVAYDTTNGHIVEEIEGLEANIVADFMLKKYGKKSEVVRA
jgi:hypothetical protein